MSLDSYTCFYISGSLTTSASDYFADFIAQDSLERVNTDNIKNSRYFGFYLLIAQVGTLTN